MSGNWARQSRGRGAVPLTVVMVMENPGMAAAVADMVEGAGMAAGEGDGDSGIVLVEEIPLLLDTVHQIGELSL